MSNFRISSGSKKYEWSSLLGIIAPTAAILLFLYLCFLSIETVVFKNELKLYGTDPYYHVRRIWLTALSFPRIAEFDWYVNYPGGAYIQWPPGFSYLLGAITRLFYGPAPTLYEAGVASVFVTPVLGALNIALCYHVAHRWFGQMAACLTAIYVALSFPLLFISVVGRVDHHVLEPFFLVLVFYLLARSNEKGGLRASVLAGASISFSFLFVPVSNAFAFMVFGFIVFIAFYGLFTGKYDKKLTRSGVRVLFWAAIIAYPLSMTSYYARSLSFEISPLSLFQPTVTAVLCLALWGFGKGAHWWSGRAIPGKKLLLVLLGIILVAALAILFTPLRQALDFLSRDDPISATVIETQSFIDFGISDALTNSTFTIFLVPPILILLLRNSVKFPDKPWPWYLFYLLLITTALSMLQIRLLPLLSPVLGLSMGWAAVEIFNKLEQAGTGVFKRGGLRVALQVAVISLPIVLMAPSADIFRKLDTVLITKSSLMLGRNIDVYLWLKNNTPDPGYFSSPQKKPDYGVLADWSYGHYLNFYAERPNIANPFGWGKTHRGGVFAVSRFLVEGNRGKAIGMLKELGARYVLVEEPDLARHLTYLGQHPGKFYQKSRDGKYVETARYFSSMGSRLFYGDGSAVNIAGKNISAVTMMRLVYDSNKNSDLVANFRQKYPYTKVFELVKGAVLAGQTKPGVNVIVTLDIVTSTGRKFTYTSVTSSDSKGRYSLVLPYSTKGNPYETGAAGQYIVSSAGKQFKLDVNEHQVINGSGIKLDLL